MVHGGAAAPGDDVKAPTTGVIAMKTVEQLQATMGADFTKELIATFLNDTPKLFDDLRKSIEAQNADGVRRAAHTLKSNGATFGAMAFSDLAKELEALGKAGTLLGALERASQLEADFAQVKRALESI